MVNSPGNRLMQSISQRFGCQVNQPLPMGTLLHGSKERVTKIVVGVRWDIANLDWQYQVADVNWRERLQWLDYSDLSNTFRIDEGDLGVVEQDMLAELEAAQLRLVADWLNAESIRQAGVTPDIVSETIGYMSYRLRTLLGE